jgi:hypothetical protein
VDDQTVMYGKAEGNSKAEARREALADLERAASRLPPPAPAAPPKPPAPLARVTRTEVARSLAGAVGVVLPPAPGAPPFFLACRLGDARALAILIDEAPTDDPPLMDMPAPPDGDTPFAVACRFGHLEAAELLRARGVNIQPVNQLGDTPFYLACEEGRLDVVRCVQPWSEAALAERRKPSE